MIAQMLRDFIKSGMQVDFSHHGDYFNAVVYLRDGVTVSIGYGASHYSSTRFDRNIGPTTALLLAERAEVVAFRNMRAITEVKGYQSSRQIRALVRKWS